MILDYGIRVRLIGRTQTYSSSISRRTRRLNDYLLEMYVLSFERVAYSYNTCRVQAWSSGYVGYVMLPFPFTSLSEFSRMWIIAVKFMPQLYSI